MSVIYLIVTAFLSGFALTQAISGHYFVSVISLGIAYLTFEAFLKEEEKND